MEGRGYLGCLQRGEVEDDRSNRHDSEVGAEAVEVLETVGWLGQERETAACVCGRDGLTSSRTQ